MLPEQWARLREIFNAALGAPDTERAAVLDRECGSDESLRRMAEGMLSRHFLHPGSTIGRRQEAPASSEHDQAGPSKVFRSMRLLGRGGMGIVYLAEQERPRRVVALKLLRPDFVSEEALRRFELEMEALGRLEHPGIARLYEAGAFESDLGPQPWIAMEYVEGVSLSTYIKERNPGIEPRLQLLSRLCEAMAHAHQRNVVHRDLKPDNILVDQNGAAKIVDFGIARLMDADSVRCTTVAGRAVGTLAYMSPEQAAGALNDIDTRTDVYGLGAVAYFLLAGRAPHQLEGLTPEEALRVLRARDPSPASASNPRLHRDLDAVIGKALEKDRSDRYQHVGDLRADIKRFLRHEPVLARPQTRRYRARKWVRRHFVALTIGAALVVLLLAGLAGTSAGLYRELLQRRALQAQLELDAAINKILFNILTGANPEVAQGREVTAREILDIASDDLDRSPPVNPVVEGGVRNILGFAYQKIGRFDPARRNFERAVDLYKSSIGASDPTTLVVMNNLATLLHDDGKLAAAEAALRAVVMERQRVLGADNPDTIVSEGNLAAVCRDLGKLDEAEIWFRRVLEATVRRYGRPSDESLTAMNNLATNLEYQGQYDAAEELFREVLVLGTGAWGGKHPNMSMTLHNLALVLADKGMLTEAIAEERRALSLQQEVSGPDHRDTLITMSNLGSLLLKNGLVDESLSVLRDAIERGQQSLGDQHPDVLLTRFRLAQSLLAAGQTSAALTMLEQAAKGQEVQLGPDHPYTLSTKLVWSLALMDGGDAQTAGEIAREVLESRQRTQGEASADTAIARYNVAMALLKQARPLEAEPLFNKTIAWFESAKPKDEVMSSIVRAGYGACLLQLHRYEEAEESLVHAHIDLTRQLGPDHERVRSVEKSLVELYEATGDDAQAERNRR